MKTYIMLFVLLTVSVLKAEPADLTRAKLAYEQAVERALTPIKAAYSKELTRMIDDYTKAGKFDEALAVKNELGKLKGGVIHVAANSTTGTTNFDASDVARLRERFVERTFVTSGGTHFTFNKDGTGKQRWNEGTENFQWEILSDKSVRVRLPQKQYFFWFESRFKGELADTPDATRRPVKVKDEKDK